MTLEGRKVQLLWLRAKIFFIHVCILIIQWKFSCSMSVTYWKQVINRIKMNGIKKRRMLLSIVLLLNYFSFNFISSPFLSPWTKSLLRRTRKLFTLYVRVSRNAIHQCNVSSHSSFSLSLLCPFYGL